MFLQELSDESGSWSLPPASADVIIAIVVAGDKLNVTGVVAKVNAVLFDGDLSNP